jgi:hypothetical protein
MKRDILLVALTAIITFALSSRAPTQAADVPISRGDVDRIVRALENQTSAIREAGRCR